ncbi:hypothetical protein FACS1894153_0470 [Bacteroidia bacterium]|nr:hypothetical protein FACS1894153_0470 [Bacteroidia bacterium]
MAKVHKDPIKEAERYLQNAKEILSEKAGKDGDYYTDPKYVRMAGNTAWNGVLVALDGVLPVRENLKKGQRLSIDHYKDAVYKRDRKMIQPFISSYNNLHMFLGYDGELRYKTVKDGMDLGKQMVAWAAKYHKPTA